MAIPLTKELLTTKAEELAECICENETQNKMNQIRKFYDDFVLLKAKADRVNEEQFEKTILPRIYFSIAKITYSVSRNYLTEKFKSKIVEWIEKIDNKSDFSNFMDFYQATICYAAYKSKK